jgi:Domain of unknown function (DUF4287)
MSFQAYLDNIKAKTGKDAADFKRLASAKGFMVNGKLRAEVKAGAVVSWLKEEFSLRHGRKSARGQERA